ncbi:MAG: hypothetical protein M1472_02685 [Planctomycetes bacterium]|nr:hypothetical protein [Planctomycetota bacterium]MDA8376831.1 hypothetical protein [Planctomycetia bacterium]
MPRMKMTPLVRISLLALRLYLLILLTLIIVSFARVLQSGKSETAPATTQPAPVSQPAPATAMPPEKALSHARHPPHGKPTVIVHGQTD